MKQSAIFKGSLICGLLSLLLLGFDAPRGSELQTRVAGPMMRGLHGWQVTPLVTVGERLPSADERFPDHQYQPVGLFDGLGAFRLTPSTVRVLVNHELEKSMGYAYHLKNGTQLTGARVSFFDVDRHTRRIVDSGLAYVSVVDRQGEVVTTAKQINQRGMNRLGFSRFCSATFIEAGAYGFVDPVYFLGEEVADPLEHPYGGSLWVLDVGKKVLHGVSATGRMNFENIAPIDIQGDRVALLIGDDTTPQTDVPGQFGQEANVATPPRHVVAAPLWLYIGEKNASLFKVRDALPSGLPPPTTDFLNRNGLLVGKLYYFVADQGMTTVTQFHGTGSVTAGVWREIKIFDQSKAGRAGYDELGYKNGFTLRREAKSGGAFQFSRPEDVSTHPDRGTRVAFASTGRASVYDGHDSWGTIYQVDVDLAGMRATLTILYDGDDAGGGQVESPDHGIRSPDNLDWSHDGFVYIQEDNSKELRPFFGSISGEEASIWRLDPENGTIQRIAQMDHSQVTAAGTTDPKFHMVGKWESSGIVDVSELFDPEVKSQWLLATVQAHKLTDRVIEKANLVEGGQLILLHKE